MSAITTTTVAPPGIFASPPGVTANFIDPPNNTNGLVPLIGVFLTLATIVLGLRLYTKTFLMRRLPGWEDVAITVAWICDVAVMAFYIRGIQLGGASHIWNFTMNNYPEYARLAAAMNLLYSPATGLPKIAILIFYLRINPSHAFRISTFIVMGLTFAYILGIFLVQLFACHPIEKLWKPLIPGTCINERSILLAIPIIDTVLNVFTLCLPIPMLIKLRMGIRTKLALMASLSVGSCTVILSATRIWSISELLDTPDSTWSAAISKCLTVVEINLMIICSSVLVLRPFCHRHLPFVLGRDERQGSSDELLGSNENILTEKPKQTTLRYDGPMGPLSTNQYRAKVRAGLAGPGVAQCPGRKLAKRTVRGLRRAQLVLQSTNNNNSDDNDDNDEDLESLNAELKRLPMVHMKLARHDNLDAAIGRAKEGNASGPPISSFNVDWPMDNNQNSTPVNTDLGTGTHGCSPMVRKSDFQSGILKTISLDVR